MTVIPLTFDIRHRAVTASTNDDVMAAAATGAPEGFVLYADTQTEGRGRRGRSWVSPRGNLYASLLLRPASVMEAGHYSFVIALALVDTLTERLDRSRIRVKWPNDVLVDGAKIAGILLETVESADGQALVAGLGVNLVLHPQTARYPATSLHALGFAAEKLVPEDFLKCALGYVNHYRSLLLLEGFSAIRDIWLAQAAGIGEKLTVRLPDAEIEGDFSGIDDRGCLLLKQQGGMVMKVATGDVFLRRG